MAASAANARGIDVRHGNLDESTTPADVLSTLDVIEHLDYLDAFAALVKTKCRSFWVIKVPSSSACCRNSCALVSDAAGVDEAVGFIRPPRDRSP